MRILIPLALATLSFVPAVRGADLSLEMHGGAVLQTTTLSFQGTPNAPYILLFDIQETSLVVNPDVTLLVAPTFAPLSVLVPGFFGSLDGAGSAQATVMLPNDPFLLATTVSFQAVAGNPIDAASNLVRLTAATAGTFEPTLDTPDLPIVEGTVAETADGKLLFVGGSGPIAQEYDPDLEEWTTAGATAAVGTLGQSTTLADGRILFTGGLDLTGQPSTAAAVWDPATGQSTTLAMGSPRAGHGASLLGDGRVLISGGFQTVALTDLLTFFSGIQGTTELFDPNTNTFAAGPGLLEPRALHSSTSTTTGKVLIAGGLTLIPFVNLPTVSNTAYLYSNGSFGLPSFFGGSRMFHSATALPNGKVLLAGGVTLDLTAVIQSGDLTQLVVGSLADGQVFTPGFLGGTFSAVTGLSAGRAGAGVVPLENGEVLIVGGVDVTLSAAALQFNLLTSADLYDGSSTFKPTGSLTAGRLLPVLAPLPDGTVLVAGGGPTSAEVYQP